MYYVNLFQHSYARTYIFVFRLHLKFPLRRLPLFQLRLSMFYSLTISEAGLPGSVILHVAAPTKESYGYDQ